MWCVSSSFGEEREKVKSQKVMRRGETAERREGRERKRKKGEEKKGKEKRDVAERILNHCHSTKENRFGKIGKTEKGLKQTPSPPPVLPRGDGEHTIPTISGQGMPEHYCVCSGTGTPVGGSHCPLPPEPMLHASYLFIRLDLDSAFETDAFGW